MIMQSALCEEQGLPVLAQQVPSVAKWWLSCKRRVTASVTVHASNNGAMYISQRGAHTAFHTTGHGSCYRALVVEVLLFVALDALPQLLSQRRLMNKQLNNIVGGNFPGVP